MQNDSKPLVRTPRWLQLPALLPVVLVATTLAEDLGPGEFEVQPRELAWQQLIDARVDLAWCLPDERRLAGKGFMASAERLLAVRFEPVALPPVRTADGEERADLRAESFGDLAAAALSVPRAARAAWLDSVPTIEALRDWPDALAHLTDTHGLWNDWDPEDDDDDDRDDGIWTTSAWELTGPGEPWSDHEPDIQQAAALITTDLATVKVAENDYRLYLDNIGTDYETIFPVDGEFFVGTDDRDEPYSALEMRFESDLPFPFGGYTAEIEVLNRVATDGALLTYIYSTSDDFNHLAGRDLFLPVKTTDGDFVGTLLVRQFSFDLDNVPDGAGDVRVGLRTALGNLKRNAEELWAERPADAPLANDKLALTRFRLFGKR